MLFVNYLFYVGVHIGLIDNILCERQVLISYVYQTTFHIQSRGLLALSPGFAVYTITYIYVAFRCRISGPEVFILSEQVSYDQGEQYADSCDNPKSVRVVAAGYAAYVHAEGSCHDGGYCQHNGDYR